MELEGGSRLFGGVVALENAAIALEGGVIHALLGEPGSGKSTLAGIMAGRIAPAAGRIVLSDKELRKNSPAAALRAGVSLAAQRPELLANLSVYGNAVIGREHLISGNDKPAAVLALLRRLGMDNVSLSHSVEGLSPAQRQILCLVRACITKPKVLILDEPALTLTKAQTQRLHTLLRELAAGGTAILYITKSPAEAAAIASTYTIIREGHTVISEALKPGTTPEELEALMPGCSLEDLYPPRGGHKPGETLLEVIGLQLPHTRSDISFTLRRGEILGLAGLLGAGRSAMARAVYGLRPAQKGIVSLGKRNLKAKTLTPAGALMAGLNYLDHSSGLDPNNSVAFNILLPELCGRWALGLCSPQQRRHEAGVRLEESGLLSTLADRQAGGLDAFARQMSSLARVCAQGSQVIILDEPAKGLRMAQKHDFYRRLHELARAGKGIILISTHLPELLHTCDTIAVMHEGDLCPPRPVDKWTSGEIEVYANSGKLGAVSIL